MAGSQDGIVAGGRSRIEGKKIPKATKDLASGLLACRSVRRSVANLRQVDAFLFKFGYSSRSL
jgi:hypothetical protein